MLEFMSSQVLFFKKLVAKLKSLSAAVTIYIA